MESLVRSFPLELMEHVSFFAAFLFSLLFSMHVSNPKLELAIMQMEISSLYFQRILPLSREGERMFQEGKEC